MIILEDNNTPHHLQYCGGKLIQLRPYIESEIISIMEKLLGLAQGGGSSSVKIESNGIYKGAVKILRTEAIGAARAILTSLDTLLEAFARRGLLSDPKTRGMLEALPKGARDYRKNQKIHRAQRF